MAEESLGLGIITDSGRSSSSGVLRLIFGFNFTWSYFETSALSVGAMCVLLKTMMALHLAQCARQS